MPTHVSTGALSSTGQYLHDTDTHTNHRHDIDSISGILAVKFLELLHLLLSHLHRATATARLVASQRGAGTRLEGLKLLGAGDEVDDVFVEHPDAHLLVVPTDRIRVQHTWRS